MSYSTKEQAAMHAVAERLVDKWLTEVQDSGDSWDTLMNTYYLACQLYVKTVDTAMGKLGEVSATLFSEASDKPKGKPN